MKISAGSLIAALLDPRIYLSGDEDGGVSLHCRDHFDGGRPLAYYGDPGTYATDPAVASVTAVPALWAEAVKHLDQHPGMDTAPNESNAQKGREFVEAVLNYERQPPPVSDGPE